MGNRFADIEINHDTGGCGLASVKINGTELADYISKVEFVQEAQQVPQVTITFAAETLKINSVGVLNLSEEVVECLERKHKRLVFSKDDFLNTDKPFRYIKENSTDQRQEEEILQLVSENAKRVGIRDFDKMYDFYLKYNFNVDSFLKSYALQLQEHLQETPK